MKNQTKDFYKPDTQIDPCAGIFYNAPGLHLKLRPKSLSWPQTFVVKTQLISIKLTFKSQIDPCVGIFNNEPSAKKI
jgi:hypothetical protein